MIYAQSVDSAAPRSAHAQLLTAGDEEPVYVKTMGLSMAVLELVPMDDEENEKLSSPAVVALSFRPYEQVNVLSLLKLVEP